MEAGVIVFDGGGWILETVAGEHTNHRGSLGHLLVVLEQACNRGSTSWLAEHALAAAQQLVGIDDFSVGDGHEAATAFAAHI